MVNTSRIQLGGLFPSFSVFLQLSSPTGVTPIDGTPLAYEQYMFNISIAALTTHGPGISPTPSFRYAIGPGELQQLESEA